MNFEATSWVELHVHSLTNSCRYLIQGNNSRLSIYKGDDVPKETRSTPDPINRCVFVPS